MYGIKFKKYVIFVGDDFYPDKETLNYTEVHKNANEYSKLTSEEFRAMCKRMHRSEMRGAHEADLRLNFELPNGHVPPVPGLKKHKL